MLPGASEFPDAFFDSLNGEGRYAFGRFGAGAAGGHFCGLKAALRSPSLHGYGSAPMPRPPVTSAPSPTTSTACASTSAPEDSKFTSSAMSCVWKVAATAALLTAPTARHPDAHADCRPHGRASPVGGDSAGPPKQLRPGRMTLPVIDQPTQRRPFPCHRLARGPGVSVPLRAATLVAVVPEGVARSPGLRAETGTLRRGLSAGGIPGRIRIHSTNNPVRHAGDGAREERAWKHGGGCEGCGGLLGGSFGTHV